MICDRKGWNLFANFADDEVSYIFLRIGCVGSSQMRYSTRALNDKAEDTTDNIGVGLT